MSSSVGMGLLIFGVLPLHLTMIYIIYAAHLAAMQPFLVAPLFVNDILDHDGHTRSRRQAS